MIKRKLELYYNAIMLPGCIFLFVFSIMPMFGLIMAFENFQPFLGIFRSKFIGLEQFRLMLLFPDARRVMTNTVIIAVGKIILNLLVPVIFALLLNEIKTRQLKRTIQTVVYLPYFLSWVIVAVIFSTVLSYTGMVNTALKIFGLREPIMFLVSNTYFRPILILSDVWKNFGFNAIIYIAAITGIDLSYYEAADIDGANRWQKVRYVTIPSIMSTIIIMATLSLGDVLNAGFDQVFNMYNPIVYQTGDILDTYVYRVGLQNLQYSFATAVGMFKSVVSFSMIILSYKLAYKFARYKIF